MEIKNIFGTQFNWKSLSLLLMISLLPNLFGLINLPTPYGFKIHVFQYFIFLAAILYGPFGGLVAGAAGSVFTAYMLNNPYIVIGNMILGFFTAYFYRKGKSVMLAVMFAFSIQLPWLYLTDVYIVGMPSAVVDKLIIGLLISNLVWAFLAKNSFRHYLPLTR